MANFTLTYSSLDDIKSVTSISNTVDPKHLEPYIAAAEAQYVLPVLGTELDARMKAGIAAGDLTPEEEDLLDNFIKFTSAYATWMIASTFLYTKTTNKGIVFQDSDTSSTIDYETFGHYRSTISAILSQYTARLKDKVNADFSNYSSEGVEDVADGVLNMPTIYGDYTTDSDLT